MQNFWGGDFTFQKNIYIYFFGFKKKIERGVEMEDPKNVGMEMDDPKNLACFARKYPRIPYFCLFFTIFWGIEGDFFLIPNRRHFYAGTTFFNKFSFGPFVMNKTSKYLLFSLGLIVHE